MKKIILGLLLFSAIAFGQCEEFATGFGNNQSTLTYNVNGDVSVILNNDQLTFKTGSNYSTATGPDVRVYLVNSEGKSDQEIRETSINNMPNIPFGLVTFSGEQQISIDVPNNVNLEDYDVLFFYCFQFSAFWDFSKIDLENIENCSLSIKTLKKVNEVSVYPNPVNDKIYLDGNTNRYSEYKIMDTQGRIVKQSNQIPEAIELNHISKGIYTLLLSSPTFYEVEKIVVN